MNSLNEVLTLKEAADLWRLNPSTLRYALQGSGEARKYRFRVGVDYRKSGGTWLVTRAAMKKRYGKEKVMYPNKGDCVRVWKAVMGREYQATGEVTQSRWDKIHECLLIKVDGDWWLALNDLENSCEIVPPIDAHCHRCGAGIGYADLEPVDVAVNYGEDGQPDPGGAFVEHHTEWRCGDRTACNERRHKLAQVAESAARAEDGALREEGWGVIGGPAR